ncbi:MAG: hypothetical protein KC415_23550, partial [Anaerolineales bacterium]|nr:hypothetical protein [Anaerolineales bacterium]
MHIDLAKLESLIRERGKPVHVNILTQTAVSAWLEQNAQARPYAPGDTYKVGETIQFNSRSATITATQLGYNPQQGNFQILTLTLPDSSLKHMAAGMVNAPPVDRLEITPERVQKMVAKEGLAWRTAVHNILATDERFVTFQDEQGDQYCLAELLPGVTAVELRQAWEIIQSEAGELFTTVATENLVADLWGLKNDGGDEYHLFAFALNIALQAYHKVQYVAGAGWMLAEHWQHMGKRPSLVGPRMANTVPEATDATEDEDEVATPPEATKTTSGLNPDLESWRQARRNEVAFTLRASHYYGRWLPLNKQTQQLFPPRPCQITIYHHFGEQEGSFTAVLDPKHKRILAKPAMYEAFHENGIYPGARLTISHRGTDYAYDIRTQPIVGEQSITVRRIALIDGQLEAWDDEEPVRYQIDGDVFVADARWEDLPALFHQAQNAGQGIFGLMFQICQRWQKERGKPLFVTATELFEEVSQQRLTSKATIAFELWRRLAFVAAEQGRYEFRAEKGGRSRLVARGHRSQTAVIPRTKQAQKTKSRHNIATDTQEVIVPKPPAFERTATGQLIATDLLPMGPLFDAASEKPLDLPRGTRCFIFQQRPDSEYEDRIGNYYSWKEGNPNSRQVQPGDRFIYYRPGEQVFFGMGQVEWIEKRGEDVDGRSLCEATISHYEAWKPPLPLTTALAKRISFIQSDVLGVGQAGIRRINPEDFHFLQQAYTAMRQGHPTIPTYPLPSPAPKSYTQPQETKGAGNPYWQGEFAQLQTVIQSQLNGTTIYTPTGRANQITQVLEVGLMVQSQRGEAVVLWEWVQQVYDKLRELGTIERSDVQHGIHHIAGGYRSAFIFGLLACFDHIEAQKPPAATLIYHTPTAPLCLRPQSSFAPPSDAPPPNPTLSTPSKPSTHLPGEDMTKTNKSLFSQHYLDFRLADQPEWQTDVMPALAQVQALYQAKAALLPQYKEAQTENEFIQPLLDILGFAYTVQPASKKGGQAQRPDYALFADGVAKTAADHHLQNDAAFFSRAIAICEAKYWERPLTQQKADSGRADFDNRNPSFQIVNYLTGTGVNWGMLTNGRLWRLYYRLADSTANEFYEIDLVSLLETADPESFKQFWLFFRREAFLADKTGRNFLERVREGSTTYARAVSDALKERVFNHVYPTLAGGFVANMAWRQEDVSSDEARALIQEATLSLLYKLLFLLYAEARDLLPVDNPGYRRHSLTQMVQEVAERVDRREVMGETATSYYGRLLSLFAMIDRGDAAFALPRYNGGLFHFDFGRAEDQQKHRANYFLHHHTINDARLAQALDLLARVEGQLVDYSFLEVRHLGAVYEGLLEYKLVIEEAAAGQVHLATDKGERKATGSYYTPDYIVKYIVHHTLDPILQAREQRFAQLMADIAPKRTRLEQLTLQSPNLSISQSPAVQSRHKNEAHILRQQLTPLEKEARETLLDIKVCDPAMGSGHF